MNVQVAAPGAARQQQTEADELADNGSPGGTGNPQAKDEDQKRVQPDIQHRAAGNADHAVKGAALEAQLIIQHQRGRHPRSTQEDDPQISLGIG